jgi:hypothetical protein
MDYVADGLLPKEKGFRLVRQNRQHGYRSDRRGEIVARDIGVTDGVTD